MHVCVFVPRTRALRVINDRFYGSSRLTPASGLFDGFLYTRAHNLFEFSAFSVLSVIVFFSRCCCCCSFCVFVATDFYPAECVASPTCCRSF